MEIKYSYKRIVEDIYNSIRKGEYVGGAQLPTEMEMCEKYGVSRITVQRAMKILGDDGVVKRISGKGTFIAEDKGLPRPVEKKLIGLLLCSFSETFGMEILRSIEHEADALGYSVIIKNTFFSLEKENEAIDMLIKLNVAGIIIQPVHNLYYNPKILELSLAHFPLVIIDREMKGLPVPFVGSDNYKMTQNAVNYIVSMNHKKILMLTGYKKEVSSIIQRISGFKETLTKHHIKFNEDMIYSDIVCTQCDEATPQEIAVDIEKLKKLFVSNPGVTCVFTTEYAIARLARRALSELGKHVPGDISLITFDNHYNIFRPNQTTFIHQKQNEIGKKAVRVMNDLINGAQVDFVTLFDGDIIDNGSVKKL